MSRTWIRRKCKHRPLTRRNRLPKEHPLWRSALDVVDRAGHSLTISQAVDRRAIATIFHHIITLVEIFFFPIVFWAGMTMGTAANSLLDVNLTQSQALSAPAYNFAPSSVGFANFALVVGTIIGLAVAEPFLDWLAMRATRRSGGIREPEIQFPALILFIIACVVGMTVSRT
jgi:hypothetical protein